MEILIITVMVIIMRMIFGTRAKQIKIIKIIKIRRIP